MGAQVLASGVRFDFNRNSKHAPVGFRRVGAPRPAGWAAMALPLMACSVMVSVSVCSQAQAQGLTQTQLPAQKQPQRPRQAQPQPRPQFQALTQEQTPALAQGQAADGGKIPDQCSDALVLPSHFSTPVSCAPVDTRMASGVVVALPAAAYMDSSGQSAPLSPAVQTAIARQADIINQADQSQATTSPALTLALALSATLSPAMVAPPTAAAKNALNTVVSADSFTGSPDETLSFRGKVDIAKQNIRMQAPEVDYEALTNEVSARGGVIVQLGKDVLRAPAFKLNLATQAGYADFPEFYYDKTHGRGDAKKLLMSEWRQQTLQDVRYTNCRPGQDDWQLTASTLVLDQASETGKASGAVLRFFDVPIFALPYFEFPLGKERRSGFLPASLGYHSTSGIGLTIPYYFNASHNYDATLNTKLMSRRGLQFTADSRVLSEHWKADTRLSLLPKDWLKGTRRWDIAGHAQYTNGAFSAGVDAEKVSDNEYFADLSSALTVASQTSLPQELWARYQAAWGELSARASRYQTLQDSSNSIVPSYQRLPVVNLALKPVQWQSAKLEFQAQTTRFLHPSLTQGNRSYAIGQMSYDWRRDWGFFTPKMALNAAYYGGLNGLNYTGIASASRSLPMTSIDTGLTFERPSGWFGQSVTQTLEPRLYFLYVPFKDQSALPVFDSAVSSFSFAQIFSNNVFSGQDRIADAKHLTPAITSKWIDTASGTELFKATLGRRYYYNPQRVQLTGPSLPAATNGSSDWLFAAAGKLSPAWSVDTALQYNQENSEVVSSTHTLKYNPAPRQLFGITKRFSKDVQNSVDASWQWRISPSSAVLGKLGYSLGVAATNTAKGLSESLLGYEYDAGCWVLRTALNRFETIANKKTTTVYFQIDFAGLSQFGTGSVETIKRNIPGYLPFENKPTWTYDAQTPF
jgi:LPS-assembly protein